MTAPARNYLNSSFTETPTSQQREGRPTIRLRPEDLDAIGACDGGRVRVGNRRADIVLHAEAFDGMQRGVAIVESIWPNAAFEEGLGVNALVSADPGPPLGGAVYHDTAVWVRLRRGWWAKGRIANEHRQAVSGAASFPTVISAKRLRSRTTGRRSTTLRSMRFKPGSTTFSPASRPAARPTRARPKTT